MVFVGCSKQLKSWAVLHISFDFCGAQNRCTCRKSDLESVIEAVGKKTPAKFQRRFAHIHNPAPIGSQPNEQQQMQTNLWEVKYKRARASIWNAEHLCCIPFDISKIIYVFGICFRLLCVPVSVCKCDFFGICKQKGLKTTHSNGNV